MIEIPVIQHIYICFKACLQCVLQNFGFLPVEV